MSNSSLVTYIKISPHSNPRTEKISKITIHHMAAKATVQQCGATFQTRKASANYGVDNNCDVGMYVEENRRSWASSSPENDQKAVTIELANDSVGPEWHVSDKVIAKCIELCVDICKRNGIPKLNYTGDKNGNLTMHCMFAATACPGPYMKTKFQYIADEVNKKLQVKTVTTSTELKKGSKGDAVKTLQTNLNTLIANKLISNTKLAIDGDFGTNTENCVKVFQKKYNLYVDGIYGKNSQNKMAEVLKLIKTTVPTANSKVQAFKTYNVKITPKAGVNMRSNAGTNYSIILAIPYNKIVTVKEEKVGWGYVSYNGKSGWIKLSNTTKC